MSAGRGIIHSEMPTQDTAGLHGFQLWFNLPAAQKMQAPRYRDLPLAELAQVGGTGCKATAISGEWIIAGASAMDGPLHELTPQAAMADVSLEAGVDITLDTEPGE